MAGYRSSDGLREFYQDISGTVTMAASDTTKTLVTVKNANYQLHIQRIIVYINTDAAQSWTFQDSNGTPLKLCAVTTSPGADTRWDFDFGDAGYPLTLGKNLTLTTSAAGLAGDVRWYGFQKLQVGATDVANT